MRKFYRSRQHLAYCSAGNTFACIDASIWVSSDISCSIDLLTSILKYALPEGFIIQITTS